MFCMSKPLKKELPLWALVVLIIRCSYRNVNAFLVAIRFVGEEDGNMGLNSLSGDICSSW